MNAKEKDADQDENDHEELMAELEKVGISSEVDQEALLSNSDEWEVLRTNNCPACGDGTLRRVHRTSLEKMRLIKRKYECDVCSEIIYKR